MHRSTTTTSTTATLLRCGLIALALTVLAAGCGSDDGVDDAGDRTEASDTSTSDSESTSTTESTSTASSDDSVGGSSTSTSSSTSDPSTSTTATTSPPTTEPTTSTGGSELVDVQPVPITSVSAVGPTTIEVVVEGGVEPCFIVERVDKVETADEVELTVNAGSEPGAVCIEIVELHTTTVELDDPLGTRTIIDGTTGLAL